MLRIPDSELVLRLQADDVEAFDVLYHQYSQSLYANILKLTKDPDAAQDILQDVFLVLWEKRLSIDANMPVANWLFSISFYKSVKHLKNSLKKQVLFDHLVADNTFPFDEDAVWKEDKLAKVETAIQQLSPQKQKVLLRCKLAGKKYNEVAEELSISKHTVKEYLSLAITSLRTILK